MRRQTSRTAPSANANASAADAGDRARAVASGRNAGARSAKAMVARVAHNFTVERAFADAMADAGPFEPKPFIAVAVSGGSDSMALALLAQRWARRRKGRCVALIVDHGLRKESAAEAKLVGRRLRALGIAHRFLRWTAPKPASGIQEAARAARYDLLTGWCRRHGALHLLTAHQADDQAETVAMRLAHRSGKAGLAAMPLVTARDGVRLVRPLLALGRDALRAFLTARKVAWVDDPSNEDTRFERIRLRNALTSAVTRRMLERAATAGAFRQKQDDAIADLLAPVQAMPEAWLAMPLSLFVETPLPVARAALERCLLCVSGDEHAPRGERLDRLLAELRRPSTFRGRTLGGCRILNWQGSLAICRELAAIATPVPAPNGFQRWDGRFDLHIQGGRQSGLTIRPLGTIDPVPETLRAARRAAGLPGPVAATLPALCSRRGQLVAVPSLGWRLPRQKLAVAVRWTPRRPLAPARFLPVRESCFNPVADYLE
jgi:tRNA(Ile)-lysidine synthase